MALVPDDTQADMLARAIAEEVPAHVAVTITRDPGGIRLGDSVRLGLGTLLLDPRDIRLGCYGRGPTGAARLGIRSAEHTSELQSLMRNSYDVFCLKKKK